MALLREGIIAANNCAEEIRTVSKEWADAGTTVINYLNGNANFQAFKAGTDKGESIYNSLNTCINTVVEQLVPTIDRVTMTTSNLLDAQQNLNRADEGTEWR